MTDVSDDGLIRDISNIYIYMWKHQVYIYAGMMWISSTYLYLLEFNEHSIPRNDISITLTYSMLDDVKFLIDIVSVWYLHNTWIWYNHDDWFG